MVLVGCRDAGPGLETNAEMVELHAGAIPSTWEESCAYNNCPRDRMILSAYVLGVSTEHDNQKDNGQDR